MYMFENEITFESRDILEEYLNGFEYEASGMCFTSLYMWRNVNDFSWEIIGDYLCISGISHLDLEEEEVFLFPPLTKTGSYQPEKLRETILKAKNIFEKKGQKFSIRLIPKHMIGLIEEAFPNSEFRYYTDRPNHDYVYLRKDLVNLVGNRYRAKRNHLNHFRRSYDYRYDVISSEMMPELVEFMEKFNEGNKYKNVSDYEKTLLKMEDKVLDDVFKNLERGRFLTGAIIIKDKIEAISIGGILGKETVVVHIEKANTNIRGAYQAINNEFSKHMDPKIKYMNREEDMDVMGLREAKLSYRPVKMIEKYLAFPENL